MDKTWSKLIFFWKAASKPLPACLHGVLLWSNLQERHRDKAPRHARLWRWRRTFNEKDQSDEARTQLGILPLCPLAWALVVTSVEVTVIVQPTGIRSGLFANGREVTRVGAAGGAAATERCPLILRRPPRSSGYGSRREEVGASALPGSQVIGARALLDVIRGFFESLELEDPCKGQWSRRDKKR